MKKQSFFKKFKKIFFKKKTNSKKSKLKTKTYQAKKLLTYTELKFYDALKIAIPNNYLIYPQINLASIINRTDKHKYQSELYRNIDFVVFNKEYSPILLIEINDKTHNKQDRKDRDNKVKEICQQANLPIIAFWTDYGINQSYINNKIAEYCK